MRIWLRSVCDDDVKAMCEWWNDPGNFAATGLTEPVDEQSIKDRIAGKGVPFDEDWFVICVGDDDKPRGSIILACDQPQEGIYTIGHVIVDEPLRRQGIGRQAIEQLISEQGRPGIAFQAGVFADYVDAVSFWNECGFSVVSRVQTKYERRGRKLEAVVLRRYH